MQELAGTPFDIVATRDGCNLFVSVANPSGIAVLKRENGRLAKVRFAALPTQPWGLVLTHDDEQLIAAAEDDVQVVDVARLLSGNGGDPLLGSFLLGQGVFCDFVNVSHDDTTLFVSEERAQSIMVIDYAGVRRQGFHNAPMIGKLTVGHSPTTLTFSRDGKLLYAVSQLAPSEWNWPEVCTPENPKAAVQLGMIRSPGDKHAEGVVFVFDVGKTRTDAANAMIGRVAAGCNPVRLRLEDGGKRFFVTARGSNRLLVFDTKKLALIGEIAVGTAPVPVAVTRDGKRVFVGNSNRWGKGAGRTLSLVDGKKLAVVGTMRSGEFPRNMLLMPDQRTLFVTNAGSGAVQMIDVRRVAADAWKDGKETP
jgi:DNA-binding beta-propeller fold protein YncE